MLRNWAPRLRTGLLQALPDEWYLRLMYWHRQGTLLNLRNPQAYTAKIQWLKLYGGLDRYASYADKYKVREYVAETVGSQFLVPLIGVWENFEEIPFDKLPEQFALKATHGQGYNFICRDRSSLDLASLRHTANAWMSENFYHREREPQYREIIPRLIVEAYLEDESGALRDYKFPCFGGAPSLVQVLGDRARGTTENYYDLQWNLLPVRETELPNSYEPVPKPAALDEMVNLASRLSSRFPFVRVDLYCVADRIYFGELTFTPGSGIMSYQPSSYDLEFGRPLDLSQFRNVKRSRIRSVASGSAV
jgi:hypothetical protein